MLFWAELVAALGLAAVGVSMVVCRLRAELTKSDFVATLMFFGLSVSAWFVGSLIKGASFVAFLVVVGLAAWALLVATWWHPAVLYREWLGGSTLSRRQKSSCMCD
jgi:hypothetical protein